MGDLKYQSVKEGIQNPKAYCAACLYWNKLFGADLLAWTSFLETPRIHLKEKPTWRHVRVRVRLRSGVLQSVCESWDWLCVFPPFLIVFLRQPRLHLRKAGIQTQPCALLTECVDTQELFSCVCGDAKCLNLAQEWRNDLKSWHGVISCFGEFHSFTILVLSRVRSLLEANCCSVEKLREDRHHSSFKREHVKWLSSRGRTTCLYTKRLNAVTLVDSRNYVSGFTVTCVEKLDQTCKPGSKKKKSSFTQTLGHKRMVASRRRIPRLRSVPHWISELEATCPTSSFAPRPVAIKGPTRCTQLSPDNCYFR